MASLTVGIGSAGAHHVTPAYHGSDTARIDSGHDRLTVEDRECDGNSVYAQAYNGDQYWRVLDANGCDTGGYYVNGFNFTKFRVCENGVGCSSWKFT